ncbi:MAG: hypothetical protein GXP48_09290 [Acidobacteria bacterium]|nr:hypothetical protein [Acidobacteriota bacterium]
MGHKPEAPKPAGKGTGPPVCVLAVRVPESLRRAVKVAAAKRGTSVQALVIEALRRELEGEDL